MPAHRHPLLRPIATCCALAALACLIQACGTPQSPAAPKPVPAVANPGRPVVAVSEADAGAAVTLEAAQQLVVSLPLEAASGLEWSLVDLKPGVLTVTSSKFERALRNTNVEEAAGASVWHLRPAAAGQVTLHFELRRPHSLQPAVRSAAFDVTVK